MKIAEQYDLKGKIAIITGAGDGIGKASALKLAEAGADVVCSDLDIEKARETAKEAAEFGVKALAVKCNVTIEEDLKNLVDETIKNFGKVNILVNNAGGGSIGPIVDFSDDDWQHNIDLDLTAVFKCMREFGKEMIKNGYGRIINVASILGLVGTNDIPVIGYQAAKGGVVNLTRAAAAEWAKTGVTVNAIAPGFFSSEANSKEAMEAMDGFIRKNTPMDRPGKDGELDSAIVFLAADESTYVTGTIIACDGGWTAI